jgi:hypothetical protein
MTIESGIFWERAALVYSSNHQAQVKERIKGAEIQLRQWTDVLEGF